MVLLKQVGIGIKAGLLAGGFVAATFFVADLARLAPLATPVALSGGLLGSVASTLDSPIVLSGLAIVSFGGHLMGITLIHFIAFATLGAAAAMLFHSLRVPLNVLSGALYGLFAFSLVFYAATGLTDAARVVDLPSAESVLVVNLVAGAIMGTYFQLMAKRALRVA